MSNRNRKQSVSLRLTECDLKKVREISKRLGVKESELFRYIIRNSLAKLLPFHDEQIKGVDLLPTLMECGSDLARFLDIDADNFDRIVNNGIDEAEKKVEKSDLEILVLSATNQPYVLFKLSELTKQPVQEFSFREELKEYLYSKYMSGELKEANDLLRTPSLYSVSKKDQTSYHDSNQLQEVMNHVR